MKKYVANILYKYNEKRYFESLEIGLRLLGFEPKYMSVFFDEYKGSINDVSYDEEYLLKLIKKKPVTVTIVNQLYDENERDKNCWFRIRLNVDSPFGLDTYSLEWSNSDLDFLHKNNYFDKLIIVENIIYCYLYNQYDAFDQSNESVSDFIKNYPNKPYNVVKDFKGDNIINLSEHWGRYVIARGITFMAAPLMWFGEEFFKIISKDDLLKYQDCISIQNSIGQIVQIKLFEVTDDPEEIENRLAQKGFWKKFDLENKIKKYEKERPFDFVEWQKRRARKNKKK